MADPAALRTRRYRLHRRGDHSICVVGRCSVVTPPVTRDTASDQREQTGGLEAPGRALWSEVTGAMPLTALQRVLLLEACRIVDRLDKLDAQLRGDDRGWLEIELPDDDRDREVVVIVDRALVEARQQAVALKQLVGEIRQADKPAARPTTTRSAAASESAGASAEPAGEEEGESLADLIQLANHAARRDSPAG
ncbi:hypothetical protein [Umezawaea beigongshangensis]|uniref:hypothetical protein n=1 Tax=Umezawaea beigongshangensis TaxID=2780383 RepID=UPI0018F11B42|nr:hypothetical protein [Umezawaea beigongshangensis]